MKREEIRKSFKKTLSIIVSAAILVSGITIMPITKKEVYASATVKDINLEFGGISDPTSTEDTAEGWTGSKVYYGDNLWFVLDDSGFLFSEDAMGSAQKYHSAELSITWKDCSLRTYLNSAFLTSNFTTIEQGVIENTEISNDDNADYEVDGGDDTTDKIFLLSLEEVKEAEYGFGSDKTRATSDSSWWWLRSPGIGNSHAALVVDTGDVYSTGFYVSDDYSVRPAFNLNLDSVLFTSASGAIKSDFGVIGSDNTSTNIWKLTLKDGDEDFAVELPTTGYIGQNITVNVTNVGTGTYTQTSAILSDSTDTVVAYGKIGTNGTGDKTFTIPSTVVAGDYTLYVFEEQVNGSNETDYASNVVTTSITISAATVPTPIWVPTTDDAYRLSFVSGMPVEFTTSQVPYEFKLVNDLQGHLCFDVFHAYRGDYNIGYTYTSYANGMKVYSLSAPITVTLQIPNNIQKESRSYEMICVHQDGNVVVLTDLDTNPNTITFTTDKGYAFALCYKD